MVVCNLGQLNFDSTLRINLGSYYFGIYNVTVLSRHKDLIFFLTKSKLVLRFSSTNKYILIIYFISGFNFFKVFG